MPQERWVLASRNPKKLEELRAILADADVRVLAPDEAPAWPPVDETGATFAENAALKARAAARATGLAALADDSGLEVDALDGAPGVRSARYAGEAADDAANNALLLAELRDVPEAHRGAQFRCVVALARPQSEVRLFEGRVRGRILSEPRGNGGFGYDPLFYAQELGKTFAQARPEEKHRVSHRGRALAKLRAALEAGAFGTEESAARRERKDTGPQNGPSPNPLPEGEG